MEHRWGQRRRCRARVCVSAGAGVSGSARLRDVSISGAFLETALPLPLFAQIAIAVLRDDGSTARHGIHRQRGALGTRRRRHRMVRARVGLDLPRAGLYAAVRGKRYTVNREENLSMRTDKEIASDVAEELRWSPDVRHSNIHSRVKDGIVTLIGAVSSNHDKYLAECAAKRVLGVTGIANDIQVFLPIEERRSDTQIAHDAAVAIRADLPVVAEYVQIVVRDGHVTLDGSVEWQWQRQRLESTVRAVERRGGSQQPARGPATLSGR